MEPWAETFIQKRRSENKGDIAKREREIINFIQKETDKETQQNNDVRNDDTCLQEEDVRKHT